MEPLTKGGYAYPLAAETTPDSQGWFLKKTPAGWYRVVAARNGYASRVVGFGQFDDQPRRTLSLRAGAVGSGLGRVTDEAGQPLADVKVLFLNVTTDGARAVPNSRGPFVPDRRRRPLSA